MNYHECHICNLGQTSSTLSLLLQLTPTWSPSQPHWSVPARLSPPFQVPLLDHWLDNLTTRQSMIQHQIQLPHSSQVHKKQTHNKRIYKVETCLHPPAPPKKTNQQLPPTSPRCSLLPSSSDSKRSFRSRTKVKKPPVSREGQPENTVDGWNPATVTSWGW